ncbi:hypothetical protein IMM1_31730 [Pseudocoprococcus immobilis]
MLNKKFLIDITREVLNHAQQENLRKLEQISLLADNWDGNGAKAFDKQLVAKVKDLIGALGVQPEIFPLSYGSIQMEYTKEDGSYLEFEINLNDTWDAFELNENGEESAFSVAADAEAVNKVAKKFMQSPKENTISLIGPTLLVQYLMSKGWKIFPRKRQDIKVLQIKKADGSFFQVTIPLSKTLSDYSEALSVALETVAEAEDMDKKQLIEKLISPTVNNSAIE